LILTTNAAHFAALSESRAYALPPRQPASADERRTNSGIAGVLVNVIRV
jgi:hypothetical protein